MTERDDETGAAEGAAPVMPDFIRQAILKQGHVDPDEIERQAALVNLDEDLPGDRPPPPPPEHVQDPLDLGIPIAPRDL